MTTSDHTLQEALVAAVPFAVAALMAAIVIAKARRDPLAFGGGIFGANLSGVCVDDPLLRGRLVAALEERRKIEPVSLPVKLLSIAWLLTCAGILGVGSAGIITRALVPICYGALCLGLAAIMMYVYFQIRNPRPVRVALLQARTSAQVIPPYWFAAACAGSAMTLAFALLPDLRIGALLVCTSSLATAAIAWRLTRLPARLAGKDIEVERFIDDELRFRRAAKTLMLALLQTYVFVCIALKGADAAQVAASTAEIALFFGYVVWMMSKIRRHSAFNGAVV